MDHPTRWTPPFWLDRLGGWSWRLLAVVVAAGVLIAAVAALQTVVLPVFIALLLSAGVSPLQRRMVQRGLPRSLGAAICVLALLLVGAAVAFVAARAIWSQAGEIGAAIDAAIRRLQEAAADAELLDPGSTSTSEGRDIIERALRFVGSGVLTLVSTAVSLVTQLFVTVFVTFFMLKDGPALWRWFLLHTGRHVAVFDQAGRRGFDALAGYVRGAALVATVDAVFIGAGAWALGVPFAGAIAVLTLVLSFVPIVGAIIAGGFATLLAVAHGGIGSGLAMLAIVLVVQQIESNVLQPMVLSKATSLHPLVVFLAVIAGGAVAGFIGIVAAVPLTAAGVAVGAVLRQAGLFRDGDPLPVVLPPTLSPDPDS